MELGKFGNDVSIKVTSEDGKFGPIDILVRTPSSVTYEGNLDTTTILSEQLATVQKRTNAYVGEQLLGWANVTAAKKLIGTQKLNDAQVWVGDFGDKTGFDVTLNDDKSILIRVWLPVGIQLTADKPMEVLKGEFIKLRQRIAKGLKDVCHNYKDEVNIRATQVFAVDLGFDVEITAEGAIVKLTDDDNRLGVPVCGTKIVN
jgi:hypothetical protein